jgi:hypothetical protein
VVPLSGDPGDPGDGGVAVTTGAYRAWLAGLGAVAVLVRPDHYLYGTAADGPAIGNLIESLRTDLTIPAANR